MQTVHNKHWKQQPANYSDKRLLAYRIEVRLMTYTHWLSQQIHSLNWFNGNLHPP